jgi:hypothetical protein
MPKCMLSRFVTDEESYGRKPLLRYLFLFRMDGVLAREVS